MFPLTYVRGLYPGRRCLIWVTASLFAVQLSCLHVWPANETRTETEANIAGPQCRTSAEGLTFSNQSNIETKLSHQFVADVKGDGGYFKVFISIIGRETLSWPGSPTSIRSYKRWAVCNHSKRVKGGWRRGYLGCVFISLMSHILQKWETGQLKASVTPNSPQWHLSP